MSFLKSVSSNGEICLFDHNGNSVWLSVNDEDARLLDFSIPPEHREEGTYAALISVAESEAFINGKTRMICDFPDSEKGLRTALSDAEYAMEESDKVIFVKTRDLLSSAGVEKSLRMKFPQVEAVSFSDLVSFQREEVAMFLNKARFSADKERLKTIDPDISAVAYDDNYEARAILLASKEEDEILVELLLGFSAKKPQYILAVCQKFAESLIEQKLQDQYPRISMLTLNANVVPLLKRLLDKQCVLETEAQILHAEKKLTGGDSAPEETSEAVKETHPLSPYQKNITEKYIWASKRKG
ncbi:MAG: hypothetical protein IKO61_05430 [Lachnospiraceae bacterium]|nr:hypothetical protein [Lachnospiraceae bacterium]